MVIRLSKENISSYLNQLNLFEYETQELIQLELKPAKNFNLLAGFSNDRQFLIKQERPNQQNKVYELLNEWKIHEFLQLFPSLKGVSSSFSQAIHFDVENSVLILNYLDDFRDLADFYAKENIFPPEVAGTIATILSKLHQLTFKKQEYQNFLLPAIENNTHISNPLSAAALGRIEPEIFGSVPIDALKFFALYQRYPSLGQAITDITDTLQPCCLTHNDLKLNNILLHNDWEQLRFKAEQESCIRIIDWERGGWGDPACDLGTLIASYLQIWLSSLVVSEDMEIEESLRLAATPLELIQSSISSMICTYLDTFPEILEHRPDFLKQIVQCTGLALIQQIQASIQYQKTFGNSGICTLQVAKSLLCRPVQSIPTIFGTVGSELLHRNHASVR